MLTRFPNGGFLNFSWDEKELNKVGDPAAIEVTKLTDGKDLSADKIRQSQTLKTLAREGQLCAWPQFLSTSNRQKSLGSV